MKCMSGRAGVDARSRTRRIGSVAATALLALFVAVLALPLCSAMVACDMPCCERSDAPPTHNHEAMPSGVCGGAGAACSVTVVRTWGDTAVLSIASPLVEAASIDVHDRIPSSAFVHVPRSHSNPAPRRLYVVNDVFLI